MPTDAAKTAKMDYARIAAEFGVTRGNVLLIGALCFAATLLGSFLGAAGVTYFLSR